MRRFNIRPFSIIRPSHSFAPLTVHAENLQVTPNGRTEKSSIKSNRCVGAVFAASFYISVIIDMIQAKTSRVFNSAKFALAAILFDDGKFSFPTSFYIIKSSQNGASMPVLFINFGTRLALFFVVFAPCLVSGYNFLPIGNVVSLNFFFVFGVIFFVIIPIIFTVLCVIRFCYDSLLWEPLYNVFQRCQHKFF